MLQARADSDWKLNVLGIGGSGEESGKLFHLGAGDAVLGVPAESNFKDGVDEIGPEFRGDRGGVKANEEPTSPGLEKHRAGG